MAVYLMGSINVLQTQFFRFSVHSKPQRVFPVLLFCLQLITACQDCEFLHTASEELLIISEASPFVPIVFSRSQTQII